VNGYISLFTEHAGTDVEWIPDRRVGVGPIRGRDKVIEFFTDNVSVFGDMDFEVEQIRDLDDQVLVFIRVRGSGSTSGASFDIRVAHLWTLRKGKLVRGQGFGDRDEALEAAGVSE
jgi:ketosteroid isomerase-like protein